MKSPLLLLLPLLASASTAPPPTLDLKSLHQNIANATTTLETSLNSTRLLNTSELIQTVGYQIGSSMANLGCANSALPTANFTSSGTASNVSEALAGAYQNYTAALTSLSKALIQRGRALHYEFDFPVQQQIQSLARVVYDFGRCLRNGGYISAEAAVGTWNAGSELADAEAVWDGFWDVGGNDEVGKERKGRRERRESVKYVVVRRTGA